MFSMNLAQKNFLLGSEKVSIIEFVKTLFSLDCPCEIGNNEAGAKNQWRLDRTQEGNAINLNCRLQLAVSQDLAQRKFLLGSKMVLIMESLSKLCFHWIVLCVRSEQQ